MPAICLKKGLVCAILAVAQAFYPFASESQVADRSPAR